MALRVTNGKQERIVSFQNSRLSLCVSVSRTRQDTLDTQTWAMNAFEYMYVCSCITQKKTGKVITQTIFSLEIKLFSGSFLNVLVYVYERVCEFFSFEP